MIVRMTSANRLEGSMGAVEVQVTSEDAETISGYRIVRKTGKPEKKIGTWLRVNFATIERIA